MGVGALPGVSRSVSFTAWTTDLYPPPRTATRGGGLRPQGRIAMPRPYEVVYIFDSTLEDAAIADNMTRYRGVLGAGGTAPADLKVDLGGRRQLAYTIGPRDTGYYVVARFSVEPPVLPEFERALKLDDGVVRYLIALHE